ncbi:MAG: hypothetical protein U5L96_04620 [Owenweeksia sp.]|nr:hypothetical protein [Owenweeksia sp.]
MSTVRGETTDQPLMQDDYGISYALKYLKPLQDERWVLTFEASMANINLNRAFGKGELEVNYQNRFSQSYLGLGMRYYMSRKVNKYNPYRGMILPFVGISAGMVNTVRNGSRNDNLAQIAFKNPPKDPTSGYEFTEGSTMEVNGQVEAGLVYVIDEAWSIEGSGLARPGFSDTWDGITGTTNTRDWFMSGSLGVQFRF